MQFKSKEAEAKCMANPTCAHIATNRLSSRPVTHSRRMRLSIPKPGDAVAFVARVTHAGPISQRLLDKDGKGCGCKNRQQKMNNLGWVGCGRWLINKAKAAVKRLANRKHFVRQAKPSRSHGERAVLKDNDGTPLVSGTN